MRMLVSQDWDREVRDSEVPVVVEFGAEWCIPCKVLGAVFDSLEEEYRGKIEFRRVDTEKEPELASRYIPKGGIPRVLYIKSGEIVHEQIGVEAKYKISERLEWLLRG